MKLKACKKISYMVLFLASHTWIVSAIVKAIHAVVDYVWLVILTGNKAISAQSFTKLHLPTPLLQLPRWCCVCGGVRW